MLQLPFVPKRKEKWLKDDDCSLLSNHLCWLSCSHSIAGLLWCESKTRKLIENFLGKFQGALLVVGYVYHNSGLFCASYIHTAIPRKSILVSYIQVPINIVGRWQNGKKKKKTIWWQLFLLITDFSQSFWSIFNYLRWSQFITLFVAGSRSGDISSLGRLEGGKHLWFKCQISIALALIQRNSYYNRYCFSISFFLYSTLSFENATMLSFQK